MTNNSPLGPIRGWWRGSFTLSDKARERIEKSRIIKVLGWILGTLP